MPTGLHFWVFNTGVKHALVDSLYATRHRECMEALNILRRFHPELPCLAAASTSQVEAAREALGDVLTRRALHITGESQRVADMEKALAAGDLIQAGQLLIASHESSRDLFENSCPELDHLVTLLRDFPGVLGCRLTGGGFGGAVMAVTSPEFNQSAAEQIAARCQETYGHTPTVIHTRSGDGARVL